MVPPSKLPNREFIPYAHQIDLRGRHARSKGNYAHLSRGSIAENRGSDTGFVGWVDEGR
jgi:hypothetical protein